MKKEYSRQIKERPNLPGQVLELHHLASLRSPGQAEPPKQERCRSDLPLPQLLVQLVQDPQLDQVTTAEEVNMLGKPSIEKVCFLLGIAPYKSGNLVLFFGCEKRLFARMTENLDDGCNDNYDGNAGNFDDNDDYRGSLLLSKRMNFQN